MKDSPCKNCGDRFIGCHGKCEKYKAWRAEYDEEIKEQKKQQNIERLLNRHAIETKCRIHNQGKKFNKVR